MTPLTTIGEVSIDSLTSVWKIQAGRSFFTLRGVDLLGRMEALLIVVAVGVQKVLLSPAALSSIACETGVTFAVLVVGVATCFTSCADAAFSAAATSSSAPAKGVTNCVMVLPPPACQAKP